VRNPFKRRVEYVTVTRPAKGVILRGLGTKFPSVLNNTDKPIRITFAVAMAETQTQMRSVEIAPHEIGPFHTNDGKFRADFIEVIS
jgi:hypothetical protein